MFRKKDGENEKTNKKEIMKDSDREKRNIKKESKNVCRQKRERDQDQRWQQNPIEIKKQERQ